MYDIGLYAKIFLKLGFSGDLGKLGKFGQNGRPLKTRQNFENVSVEKNERVKTAISDQKNQDEYLSWATTIANLRRVKISKQSKVTSALLLLLFRLSIRK